MRNNEPLHQLQQCLRDNGEQIAEKVTELQFKEVLAVNAELRAEVEKLNQDSRNYLHEVEQLKAQIAAHDVTSVPTFPCESCGSFHSYSEVAEAGGYCPQCEANYDERKMFADLLERYTALKSAPVVMPEWATSYEALGQRLLDAGWRDYADAQWDGVKEIFAELNRSKT